MALPARAFITVLLIVAMVTASWGGCPEGWTRRGFNCIRVFTNGATWKEAESFCQSFHGDSGDPGHLLSIADERDIAILSLLDVDEEWFDGLWVGLARENDKDTMTWSNGLPTDVFSLNTKGLLDMSRGGDCAQVIFRERRLTLWTANCNLKQQYACEVSACQAGWTQYDGNCYKYFEKPKSWKDAEGHCQSYSRHEVQGHLVSIGTEEENRFLTEWQKIVSKNGHPERIWIGMHGVSTGDQLNWTSERDLQQDEQARQLNAPASCVEMHTMGEGLWSRTADCGRASAHICKIAVCPLGLMAFRDQCLLYLDKSETGKPNDKRTLGEGDQRRSGRAKRTRRSSMFNFGNFVKQFKKTGTQTKRLSSARSFKPSGFSNLWKKPSVAKPQIGSSRSLGSSTRFSFGNKFASSGSRSLSNTNVRKIPSPSRLFGGAFKFKSPPRQRLISQTNPAPAPQPKAVPQQSNPAPVPKPAPVSRTFRKFSFSPGSFSFGNPGKKTASSVSGQSSVVRQGSMVRQTVQPAQRPAPPKSQSQMSQPPAANPAPVRRVQPGARQTSSQTKYCFPSWKSFDNYCYHFSKEELTWEEARHKCQTYILNNKQAYLVSITTESENAFLTEQSSPTSPAWIGLNGNTWLDGSALDYNAGIIGDGNGMCSYALNKEWGYKTCLEKMRYVCKMPKAVMVRIVRKKRSPRT